MEKLIKKLKEISLSNEDTGAFGDGFECAMTKVMKAVRETDKILVEANGEFYYVKNVMIDVDGSNLEEGIDIFDENFKYLTNVVGVSEDDDEIAEIVMLNVIDL